MFKLKYGFLSLIFLTILHSCSSTNSKDIHLDNQRNEISKADFWSSNEQNENFSRWVYVDENNDKVHIFNQPKFIRLVGNYENYKSELEALTGKKYAKNTSFLLEYNFKDDLCTPAEDNWNKTRTNQRKSFLDPQKASIEKSYQNVVVLNLFEEGIQLETSISNDYFLIDQDNKFRNSLFKEPARCGAFAIIRPDGKILVRNGEHRMDYMAELMQPEIWDNIFSEN